VVSASGGGGGGAGGLPGNRGGAVRGGAAAGPGNAPGGDAPAGPAEGLPPVAGGVCRFDGVSAPAVGRCGSESLFKNF